MNIDLEDLLRQGIDRLPDEVPAGLTHRAVRQARRHRLVTGAGVAAVATLTAAAVAIGMLAVAPTASKRPGREVAQPVRPAPVQHLRPLPSWPPGPVTQATLVSRVEQAVLTSTNYIAYTRSYNHKNRTGLFLSAMDYRNMHLLINYGRYHQAQLVINYRDRETVKSIFYPTRKWALTTLPGSGIVHTDKDQCVGPADDAPLVGDPHWAAWLVSSLRCGAYTVISHASEHGTPILTIVNTPKDVEYQYGVRIHMRVDATTYLPIADWQPGKYGHYDVITWLPPTPALLAQLALPVPLGFSSCQGIKGRSRPSRAKASKPGAGVPMPQPPATASKCI